MSIQWALPMLPQVLPDELLHRLQSASVDPHYVFPETGNSMPTYNAATGELIKQIPLVKMIRVSRRKFRALCAEGIDVQYGKAFSTLRAIEGESGVSALFNDGSSASGSLIIGADGANSAVRQAVFASGEGQAQQIPYSGVNMHVRYPDAETSTYLRRHLSPIVGHGVHPKGYWLWLSVQDVPDPDKPEDWTFQLQWTWRASAETADLAELKLERLQAEAAAVFAEPFRTAWTEIPRGTAVPANRISIWPPRPVPGDLFKGKVALVGDAAHAMSFHRGQGMNHGIEDAVQLSQLLKAVSAGEKDLRSAVDEYEAEMVKRAGQEVAVSKMNTEMMHDWARLMESPFMQRGGDRNTSA